QSTARAVSEPRGATSAGTCSTNVPLGQPGSGQRQVRCRQITRTGTTPGTSCSSRRLRPRLGATTPQVGQPISCQGVETVTVTSISVRWTASTWTSEMPRSVSQRAQGSVVGASLHPVALVNVEVLGTNGCLVATDHRGPRPIPALSYPPRVPLPTGSPKSPIKGRGGSETGRHRRTPKRWSPATQDTVPELV